MSDLISRQAAKEKACSICRWEGTENCAECEHPIDDLPTIDPVKHGKWTKCIDACGECVIVQCSECFEDFDYIDGLCYLCHGQELPNYCPNCGAKMERSEE